MATERVVQSADLQHLVKFSSALHGDELTSSAAVPTDKNRVNRLVSVLQNKVRQFMQKDIVCLCMHVCVPSLGLERLVSETTCYVSNGTLISTHSLVLIYCL